MESPALCSHWRTCLHAACRAAREPVGTWRTTTYTPTPEGHRFSGNRHDPCKVCGGRSWDASHALVETSGDLTGPARFCVEASDDNGKTYAVNGLRWAKQEDAERWASGLAMRWFGCTNIRVRRCRNGKPAGATVTQTL